ncbi:alpha/beta fold hydrolase [Streptomyces sp. H27-H1]|uniref:alpha/beta fold hydrolase n=1 Tax=Streptomyces sp. H27-H1 TaxID=2996461 RepID=UPI002D1E4426|nr:alpha/beta fold hydrolase [Streptomyces sp. H27-H1]
MDVPAPRRRLGGRGHHRGDGLSLLFAADVPEDVAGVLTATQRPVVTAAFTETASAAAWRTKQSWALVAGADRTISPEVQRFGAARVGVVVELPRASHAVALSEPTRVADLIRDGVRATI